MNRLHFNNLLLRRIIRQAYHESPMYVPYEYLQSEEKKRFPAFILAEDTIAVMEQNAGILFPEKCIKINLAQAKIKELLYFITKR